MGRAHHAKRLNARADRSGDRAEESSRTAYSRRLSADDIERQRLEAVLGRRENKAAEQS